MKRYIRKAISDDLRPLGTKYGWDIPHPNLLVGAESENIR